MRRIAVVLATLLLVSSVKTHAQEKVSDPEVVKGIQRVDEGEYEEAIVILDAAARRLAATQKPTSDLAQAYVYLGVAYLAKGHETSAKAQFREALARTKELRLTTDKFAPRVIEIFEKAREEARTAAPSAAPPPPSPAPTVKKGGSATKYLLIGGAAVVAGGAAVAVAGGGGGGNETTPPTTQPTPIEQETVVQDKPNLMAPCDTMEFIVREQQQPMAGQIVGISIRVVADRGFLNLAGPSRPEPAPLGDIPPERVFSADNNNNPGLASFVGTRAEGRWAIGWRPGGQETGKDACVLESWEVHLRVRRD